MTSIKKGDLIAVNEDGHLYCYVVAQVIKKDRFFYCWSKSEKFFTLVVYDPARHFVLCPNFNPNIEPDINFLYAYRELAKALDRLFYGKPSD